MPLFFADKTIGSTTNSTKKIIYNRPENAQSNIKEVYNMYYDSDTTFTVNGMLYRKGFVMCKEQWCIDISEKVIKHYMRLDTFTCCEMEPIPLDFNSKKRKANKISEDAKYYYEQDDKKQWYKAQDKQDGRVYGYSTKCQTIIYTLDQINQIPDYVRGKIVFDISIDFMESDLPLSQTYNDIQLVVFNQLRNTMSALHIGDRVQSVFNLCNFLRGTFLQFLNNNNFEENYNIVEDIETGNLTKALLETTITEDIEMQ